MKIYNKIVYDMNTWEVKEEDSFDYSGPLAHAGLGDTSNGGSSGGQSNDGGEGPGGMGGNEGSGGGESNDVGALGTSLNMPAASDKSIGQLETEARAAEAEAEASARNTLKEAGKTALKAFVSLSPFSLAETMLTAPKAIEAANTLVGLRERTDEELESMFTAEEVSKIRDVDISTISNTITSDPDHGGEHRVDTQGYIVPASGPDAKDAVIDDAGTTIADTYNVEKVGAIAPAKVAYSSSGGYSDAGAAAINGQGEVFSTDAWDSFVNEWTGSTGDKSYQDLSQESADFRAQEANDLIGSVTEASDQYGGLLDSLLDQATTGSGMFTPITVKAGAGTINFVPRSNRELASQTAGFGESARDNAVLGAKTKYETMSDRDPTAGRVGYLDQLGTVASKTQDYRSNAQELGDVSKRGYAGIAQSDAASRRDASARVSTAAIAASESARQFDATYAEKIRQFNETGSRNDAQFIAESDRANKEFDATGVRADTQLDQEDQRIENSEPGILDYVTGGLTLYDAIWG